MSTNADSIRLHRVHALILHAVACVLVVSGALAGVADVCELINLDFEPPRALKIWALRVHGGAAMGFLVLIGTMLPVHVRVAWRAGRNRLSGSVLLASLALLAMSGYGLYYFGDETLRKVTLWTHVSIGVLDPFCFIAHLWCGRRSRPDSAI
jgi:hypothetical protein